MSDGYDVYEHAPEGQIWVCPFCGKTASTRAGVDAEGKRTSLQMWDESCMVNAVLCYKGPWPSGKYKAVEDEL